VACLVGVGVEGSEAKGAAMRQELLFEFDEEEGAGTVSTLAAIHRGEGSFIGFARKTATGGFENLFSLELAQLEAMFPALVPWLVKDAYFTVNGMYRAAHYKNRATGLPDVYRKESHLKYLNACYVDLDVGRDVGEPEQLVTWRDAAAHLGNMMDAGELPQASIFARSGRGLYVFWLLHDEDDPSQPVRYWPESIAAYKRLQRFIVRRLEHLAADLKAVDAARVLRVPGTLHGLAQAPAVYQIQKDAQGRSYSYTLRELAAFFSSHSVEVGLPDEARSLAYGVDWVEEVEGRDVDGLTQARAGAGYGRAVARPGSAPKRVNGARVVAALRAQDMAALEQWRGGWARGRRRFHLKLYAAFLRGAGVERLQVFEAVRVMASNCRPPYPSDENDTPLEALVGEVFREPFRRDRNASLCKRLGVTPDLARELGLLTIVPDEVAEERTPPPGGQRELEKQARHDFLRAHVTEHGCASARRMLEALERAGFEVSRRTVNDDLNALGYATAPTRRAGRPSPSGVQLALDEAASSTST